ALAVSLAGTSLLMVVLARVRFGLQERVGLLLDRRLLALVAGMPGLEHHERPEYRDKLELLRTDRSALGGALGAVVGMSSVAAQAIGTAALLARLHPVFTVGCALSLGSLAAGTRAARLLVAAQEAGAEAAHQAGEQLRLAA